MAVQVSKRASFGMAALVLAALLLAAPAAQAGGRHHHGHGHGHHGGWGVTIGLPGIGLSYVDGHRGGYWGGYVNAYPRYYGGPYRYDDRYYGGYYPSYGVVYRDRPAVRRVVHRTVYYDDDRGGRRYSDDRYYRDRDYGRRARYYDR